jgi:kynurenine formamidase
MVQPARPISPQDFDSLFDELKNWGRWGQEDQRGALNLITQEKRVAATKYIQDGFTVSGALPLAKRPGPFNSNPVQHHMTRAGDLVSSKGYGVALDFFSMSSHGMSDTHLDALCHIFYNGQMYNGFSSAEVTSAGARVNTIESGQDGIIGRGVLLDIPRSIGKEWLEPGEAIYPEDLERVEEMQSVHVEEGDILLIYTGRNLRLQHKAPWNPREELAGLHGTSMRWVYERGVAVLGCDGISDVIPSGLEGVGSPIAGRPVHLLALPAMGVHLIDNCDLEAIAQASRERNRWNFYFVIAPLKLNGGTGCPVNPVAIY